MINYFDVLQKPTDCMFLLTNQCSSWVRPKGRQNHASQSNIGQ